MRWLVSLVVAACLCVIGVGWSHLDCEADWTLSYNGDQAVGDEYVDHGTLVSDYDDDFFYHCGGPCSVCEYPNSPVCSTGLTIYDNMEDNQDFKDACSECLNYTNGGYGDCMYCACHVIEMDYWDLLYYNPTNEEYFNKWSEAKEQRLLSYESVSCCCENHEAGFSH